MYLILGVLQLVKCLHNFNWTFLFSFIYIKWCKNSTVEANFIFNFLKLQKAAIVQQIFCAATYIVKAGMLFLKSSYAPSFIQTLQLIVKDLLFLENNISVSIANAL